MIREKKGSRETFEYEVRFPSFLSPCPHLQKLIMTLKMPERPGTSSLKIPDRPIGTTPSCAENVSISITLENVVVKDIIVNIFEPPSQLCVPLLQGYTITIVCSPSWTTGVLISAQL